MLTASVLSPSAKCLSGASVSSPSAKCLSGASGSSPSANCLSGASVSSPSAKCLSGASVSSPSAKCLSGASVSSPSAKCLSGASVSSPSAKCLSGASVSSPSGDSDERRVRAALAELQPARVISIGDLRQSILPASWDDIVSHHTVPRYLIVSVFTSDGQTAETAAANRTMHRTVSENRCLYLLKVIKTGVYTYLRL